MSLEGLRHSLRRIKSQYGGTGGFEKEDYVKTVHDAADAEGMNQHGVHYADGGSRPNSVAPKPDERPG